MIIPPECLPYFRYQRTGVRTDYANILASEFDMIEPYLPESVNSIVDIGCGMGGIDVYLHRKYPDARITLIDGDGHEAGIKPEYGFVDNYNTYNSRSATESLLHANGVHGFEWAEPEHIDADLIISLLAWGFHFPLKTYRVSGFCIADLRIPNERPRGSIIRRFRTANRCAFWLD